MHLAEVMSAQGDDAIAILAEQKGRSWTEAHVCFDCATKANGVALIAEAENDRREREEEEIEKRKKMSEEQEADHRRRKMSREGENDE